MNRCGGRWGASTKTRDKSANGNRHAKPSWLAERWYLIDDLTNQLKCIEKRCYVEDRS